MFSLEIGKKRLFYYAKNNRLQSHNFGLLWLWLNFNKYGLNCGISNNLNFVSLKKYELDIGFEWPIHWYTRKY